MPAWSQRGPSAVPCHPVTPPCSVSSTHRLAVPSPGDLAVVPRGVPRLQPAVTATSLGSPSSLTGHPKAWGVPTYTDPTPGPYSGCSHEEKGQGEATLPTPPQGSLSPLRSCRAGSPSAGGDLPWLPSARSSHPPPGFHHPGWAAHGRDLRGRPCPPGCEAVAQVTTPAGTGTGGDRDPGVTWPMVGTGGGSSVSSLPG